MNDTLTIVHPLVVVSRQKGKTVESQADAAEWKDNAMRQAMQRVRENRLGRAEIREDDRTIAIYLLDVVTQNPITLLTYHPFTISNPVSSNG